MAFHDDTSPSKGIWASFSFMQAYAAIARVVTRMQVSRMDSVLRTMSDQQLSEIEIERCDISKHAEIIVTGSRPNL